VGAHVCLRGGARVRLRVCAPAWARVCVCACVGMRVCVSRGHRSRPPRYKLGHARHVHVCLRGRARVCLRGRARVCLRGRACVSAWARACVCVWADARAQTYTHTRADADTHTRVPAWVRTCACVGARVCVWAGACVSGRAEGAGACVCVWRGGRPCLCLRVNRIGWGNALSPTPLTAGCSSFSATPGSFEGAASPCQHQLAGGELGGRAHRRLLPVAAPEVRHPCRHAHLPPSALCASRSAQEPGPCFGCPLTAAGRCLAPAAAGHGCALLVSHHTSPTLATDRAGQRHGGPRAR